MLITKVNYGLKLCNVLIERLQTTLTLFCVALQNTNRVNTALIMARRALKPFCQVWKAVLFAINLFLEG